MLNLKILNIGNVPQQLDSSAEDCNEGNVSHPDIPGSVKDFQKLIHIPPGQTFQHIINELKSRNTMRASFDTVMKYQINLVEGSVNTFNAICGEFRC